MLFINRITSHETEPGKYVFGVTLADENGRTYDASVSAEDLVDYYRFQLKVLNTTGQIYRHTLADGLEPWAASRVFRALVESTLIQTAAAIVPNPADLN